jgi:uncharacterized damage-inducible protein DinB
MAAHVPSSTDERTLLLGFLDQQRYAVKLTAYGLSDEQAGTTPTASALTIGGLIKHLTRAERGWLNTVRQTPASGDRAQDYADGFRFDPDETLESVIADYDAAARETRETIEAVDDLNQAVPVPKGVPWFPADVDAWSVRWVLLHLIEETARHAGHADIVRESIDGATGYPLMAAAEGWEPTPWLQPWHPGQEAAIA